MIGLTKYYASDLGKFGITCNAISPAGVFNSQDKICKKFNFIDSNEQNGKSDMQNLVDFLIDDKQKFITGQNILIDGGRTII